MSNISSPSNHAQGRTWKSGCLIFFVGIFCFFIALSLSAMIFGGGQIPTDQVTARHVSGPLEAKKIVVISLGGIMLRGNAKFGEEGGITHSLLKMLKKAKVDPLVSGVLVRLNTPGGSVTDADLVYHEIEALRNSKKTVVFL